MAGIAIRDDGSMTLAPVWGLVWVSSEDEADFYEAFQDFCRRWSIPREEIPDHLSLSGDTSLEEMAAYEMLCEAAKKRIGAAT